MGKFLDSIVEMTLKNHESKIEKENKKIASSAKSYYKIAVDNIKKAAKKGFSYTRIKIKGENSLIIAKIVDKKLADEGFDTVIKTGMIDSCIDISW